jgi:uncharacterized protein YqcC (DUF446 family)
VKPAHIDPAKVRACLDGVIGAMKDAGAWEVERPAEEAFADMGAFGMRTMAFEQWLRWVFVPSVETRLSQDGPWPDESQVGTHALRETDGNDTLQPLVAALERFDELFHQPDPEEPNALNYAGGLLLSSDAPADTERAVEYFREALRLHPYVAAPLPNLGRALLKLGRDGEAIETMEAATHETALASRAHNWLAWYFTTQREDLPRAILHGKKAVEWDYRWGLPYMNLALALRRAGREAEAYAYYGAATRYDGEHDVAYAHEMCARFEGPRGFARHMLTSWRRAIAASRDPARTEAYRAEHANVEAALRAHRVWFPSERAELRWLTQEADADPPVREAIPAEAEAALALLPAEAGLEVLRLSLETVAESARNDTMPVALIGCDWGLEVEVELVGLGAEVRDAVARVARTWDRFLRAVWALATESENPIPESEPFAEVHRLLLAARFDEALAALERAGKPLSCKASRIAESGAVRARVHGTRAQALALLECAHRAELACASMAPGREAGEAYDDADRIEARVAAWRREGIR